MAIIEREVVVEPPKLLDLDEAGRALMQAADMIRRQGWFQKNCSDYDDDETRGPQCAALAIGNCGNHSSEPYWRFATSLGFKSNGFNNHHNFIWNWNDTPGRTKEQVIEALERAAIGG